MDGAWLDGPGCQTDGLNRQPGFGVGRAEWRWCRYRALRRHTVNRVEDLEIRCEGLRVTTVIDNSQLGCRVKRHGCESQYHTPPYFTLDPTHGVIRHAQAAATAT